MLLCQLRNASFGTHFFATGNRNLDSSIQWLLLWLLRFSVILSWLVVNTVSCMVCSTHRASGPWDLKRRKKTRNHQSQRICSSEVLQVGNSDSHLFYVHHLRSLASWSWFHWVIRPAGFLKTLAASHYYVKRNENLQGHQFWKMFSTHPLVFLYNKQINIVCCLYV